MDEKLSFISPASGEKFGEVPMAIPAQVNEARREMATAQKIWGNKPIQERIRILQKLQTLIVDELDNIAAVISQDTGKSRQDAIASELLFVTSMMQAYCKQAPGWLRRRSLSPGLQIFKRAYIEYQPHGVVGVIGPWNYPFMLLISPVISALLAGNTVLAKPSEVAAATGVMIEGLFKRIPELSPYIRFLHGDGRIGAALVQSKPDLIFITGSPLTGQKVLQAAAENLTPVICELGGKDPMIVLADADLDAAARWGAWGAFFNNGQSCVSVERVYVVESVYDEFVEKVVTETQKIKVGYSADANSPYHLGPFTFDRQARIVSEHLEEALSKGAKVLIGGKRQGMFMEPTVMVDVDHTMRLMQEETFGPIMPIMKVKDETHAIQLANHSDYGLGAAVWGRDLARAQQVAQQLEVGSVIINDTKVHFMMPTVPFGGVKRSGVGRIHCEQDVLQFVQVHSYVVGGPPLPFDLATLLRIPGHYKLGTAIIRLMFGTSPAQRLQPVKEALTDEEIRPKVGKAAVALAGVGVLAAIVLNLFRPHKKGM